MLSPAVFLDGDWCWNMSPFMVTEETRSMVLDNIAYLLNNFLRCSAYRVVIFCWVMHTQSIVNSVLQRLDLTGTRVTLITLTASPQALEARIKNDIARKLRSPGVLERSLERLPLYADMDSRKLDVSFITAKESAQAIADMLTQKK